MENRKYILLTILILKMTPYPPIPTSYMLLPQKVLQVFSGILFLLGRQRTSWKQITSLSSLNWGRLAQNLYFEGTLTSAGHLISTERSSWLMSVWMYPQFLCVAHSSQ